MFDKGVSGFKSKLFITASESSKTNSPFILFPKQIIEIVKTIQAAQGRMQDGIGRGSSQDLFFAKVQDT